MLIAVSHSTAEDFRRVQSISDRSIEIIYNATATRDLMERPLRDRRCDVPQCSTILSAGTLQYRKDFPTLIRAFAIVRAQRPARLVILGDGEDSQQLAALVGELGLTDDVQLPGWSQDVPAAIKRAELLVSSSLFEGLQATLIEALDTPVDAMRLRAGAERFSEDGKAEAYLRLFDRVARNRSIPSAVA